MAVIQASSFTKSGSVLNNCTVSQSDNVGIDIVVSFASGERGTMDCFAYVTYPDGTQKSIRMTLSINSAGTYDFISTISPLQVGTYRIGEVQVWNRDTGQLLAQVYP